MNLTAAANEACRTPKSLTLTNLRAEGSEIWRRTAGFSNASFGTICTTLSIRLRGSKPGCVGRAWKALIDVLVLRIDEGGRERPREIGAHELNADALNVVHC